MSAKRPTSTKKQEDRQGTVRTAEKAAKRAKTEPLLAPNMPRCKRTAERHGRGKQLTSKELRPVAAGSEHTPKMRIEHSQQDLLDGLPLTLEHHESFRCF